MGHQISHEIKELATCGGRDGALPVSLDWPLQVDHRKSLFGGHVEKLMLMRDTLANGESVIFRTDLKSKLRIHDFIICRPDEAKQSALVAISEDGRISPVRPGERRRGDVTRHLHLPDAVVTYGGKLMVRINPRDLDELPARVYRCDSEEDVLKILHAMVSVGAENLSIVMGMELIRLDFDKNRFAGEHERLILENSRLMMENRIVTSLTFGPLISVKLKAAPDRLATYFNRLKVDDKADKDRLVLEMKGRDVDPLDIERFKEATGAERDTRGKTGRFFQILAAQAHKKGFLIYEDKPDTQASSSTPEEQTLTQVVTKVAETLRQLASKPETWRMFLSWEPLRVCTASDFMGQAHYHRAMGDDEAFVRLALRAMDCLASEYVHAHPSSHAAPTSHAIPHGGAFDHFIHMLRQKKHQTVVEQDTYVMFSTTKGMIDKLVEQYTSGEIRQERFEETFQHVCKSMIAIVDAALLPLARAEGDNEGLVQSLRTKADYLRYLHVWIPAHRAEDGARIKALYHEAVEATVELEARHVQTTTSYVNLGLLHAEVFRDCDSAAAACRSGMQRESARTLHKTPSASEIFNWQLLQSNVAAFETRIFIVEITFEGAGFRAHRDNVVAHSPAGSSKLHLAKQAQAAKAKAKAKAAAKQASAAASAAQQTKHDICSVTGFQHWMGVLRPDPTVQAAPVEIPQKDLEATPEEQVVLRWLHSQPLKRRQAGKKDVPLSWLSELQWIDHVEVAEVDEDEDVTCRVACAVRFFVPPLNVPQAKPTGVQMQEFRDVLRHLHESLGHASHEKMRDILRQQVLPDREWVLDAVDDVICDRCERYHASQVQARNEAHAHKKHGRRVSIMGMPSAAGNAPPESMNAVRSTAPNAEAGEGAAKAPPKKHFHAFAVWIQQFTEALRDWPIRHYAPSQEPKRVRLQDLSRLRDVVRCLDNDGVVFEDLDKGVIGSTALHQGDVLLFKDNLKGKSVKQLMESVANGGEDGNTLQFFPCPRVVEARIVEMAPYSLFHHLFRGFQTARLLEPLAGFQSLRTLEQDIVHSHKSVQSNAPQPRRIAGLSARRNPLQASSRGCR